MAMVRGGGVVLRCLAASLLCGTPGVRRCVCFVGSVLKCCVCVVCCCVVCCWLCRAYGVGGGVGWRYVCVVLVVPCAVSCRWHH
jgi:hypothetical protein